MGGELGERHTYCDEVIFLIWKLESPRLGVNGPATLATSEQRRSVLACPPVLKKIKYPNNPEEKFHYQKPMALYAELLSRYLPSNEPCTVAELTGKKNNHTNCTHLTRWVNLTDLYCCLLQVVLGRFLPPFSGRSVPTTLVWPRTQKTANGVAFL